MHPILGITEQHVNVLRQANITSMEAVKGTLQQAITARRKKQPLPENLNKLAGLCQRAILNPGAFKTMVRLQLREAEEHPAHHGNVVAG